MIRNGDTQNSRDLCPISNTISFFSDFLEKIDDPFKWVTSEFQKPSLSKRGYMQTLSWENEFRLNEMKVSFPY